ncbi:unnamed protein product [Calypogeia fissa]
MANGLYGPVPSREYSFDMRYGEAQPVVEDCEDPETPTYHDHRVVPSLFQFSPSLERNSFEIERRLSRRLMINEARNILAGKSPRLAPRTLTYDLAIQKLVYKVIVKDKERKEKTERTLLNSVTAEARHGELLAIFGPSGSGKTTLLDALAGRIDKKSLGGSILVNGKPMDSKFKRISGYVMQDDALFPLLTVRETLLYSARLKLRGDITYKEKEERVEQVIQQLGLDSCANTKVGNDVIRGVSGGERRRVSIGADVIHDPAVLMLDEPTSGLDSTSALQVMEHLSTMAKQYGRTVILTIHQPGYSILETIHNCLVLVQGNVIYHGRPIGMVNYFADLGYTMPDHITTVEYFLTTVSECREQPKGLIKLVEYYQERRKGILKKDEQIVIKPTHTNSNQRTYAASFAMQTLVLAERTLKNTFRTKELFLGRVVMLMVGALVMGSLFFQVKQNAVGLRQRQSFIGFSLSFVLFTSAQTLPLVVWERQIFIRETTRGAYSASAYVLSGSLVILPFLLILALVFSCISYPLVGFVLEAPAFLFFALVYFLVLTVATSFVTCIAGLMPNLVTANGVLQACLSFFFLFSGYFIQRDAIPKYWIWVHYLSLHKYPYEALMNNELKQYPDVEWAPGINTDEFLSFLSLGHVHKWLNVAILVAFTVAYRLIYYFHLVWTGNHTRK